MVLISLWSRCRSKQRRDAEKRLEYLRDAGEDGKDQARQKNEHWRKRDAPEIRCCFLCGSSAHIKRDCQLNRNPTGEERWTRGEGGTCWVLSDFHWIGNMKMETFSTPAHLRNLREQDRQVRAHVQLRGVYISVVSGMVFFWRVRAASVITGPVFTSSRNYLYKRTKKREGNKISYWVQKWVRSAFTNPLSTDRGCHFCCPYRPKTKIKPNIIKQELAVLMSAVAFPSLGSAASNCFRISADCCLSGSLVVRHQGLSTHRRNPVDWTAAASETVPLVVQGDQKSRRRTSRMGLLGRTEPARRQSQDAFTWSQ